MKTQDPAAAAAAIDRISSNKMGVQPQVATQQGQTQMAPEPKPSDIQSQAQAQPQTKPVEKETPTEKAMNDGAPKTEGDNQAENPITYAIKVGDEERHLSPQQISASMERYASLNHEHAQLKPIIALAKQLQERGISPQQLAQGVAQHLTKAAEKNPTMGNTNNQKPDVAGQNNPPKQGDADIFAKWEEENAASLPPGYQDLFSNLKSMSEQNKQMMQMMSRALAAQQGIADTSRTAVQNTNKTRADLFKERVGQNLDAVQRHLQLPDDDAEPFMQFAAERGYVHEDFVDPQLVLKVMTDYKNLKGQPEMERIMGIAQKRQAYTGSLGPTPAGGTPAPTGGESQSRLDRMADVALKSKNPV